MKKYLVVLVLIIGLFGISCDILGNKKDDNFIIKISPVEQTLSLGEETTLSVKIEGVEDLFAISAEILFNGDILQLPPDPLTVGEEWGENVLAASINEIDRLNLTIGLIDSAGDASLSGNFTLFKLNVLAKSTGETPVQIHNLYLIDETGNPVNGFSELEIQQATIKVQ